MLCIRAVGLNPQQHHQQLSINGKLDDDQEEDVGLSAGKTSFFFCNVVFYARTIVCIMKCCDCPTTTLSSGSVSVNLKCSGHTHSPTEPASQAVCLKPR